ncbi:MAG: HPr family phosphocarrier protein [Bacteroidota bacterium]
MVEATIPVRNKVGLHARPAALFVQTAAKSSCTIKIRNLTTNGGFVDAKSIIMVLTLGVMKDHEVVIQADGPDEETALASLQSLIEGNFGEG